jgi:AraC-like DNA-binding protein
MSDTTPISAHGPDAAHALRREHPHPSRDRHLNHLPRRRAPLVRRDRESAPGSPRERATHGPCPTAPERQSLVRLRGCDGQAVPPDEKVAYLPLSRTTDLVLRILLEGDLGRLRAESVAEHLGISCTTLRRRLRGDHTSYQFLLDRARQYRCEARLRERWLPGKCLADELGYLEVNSFYRAFRRWTGVSYSSYRRHLDSERPPSWDRGEPEETSATLPR